MVNQAFNCSGICSGLFHERSVKVRADRTSPSPCSTKDKHHLMHYCSVCSVFLDPSVSCVFVLSVSGYQYALNLFLTEGVKSIEQNEQSLVKYYTYLEPQGFKQAITNRTLPEQNQNSVRNQSEQTDEQVRSHNPSNSRAVLFSVPVRSVVFVFHPNTKTHYTARLSGLFL